MIRRIGERLKTGPLVGASVFAVALLLVGLWEYPFAGDRSTLHEGDFVASVRISDTHGPGQSKRPKVAADAV